MNREDQQSRKTLKTGAKVIKKAGSMGARAIIKIGTLAGGKAMLILLAAIIAIVMLFLLIIGIIYYAAPSGGLYSANAQPTAKDAALQSYYLDIATKNIYRDRWLVESGSSQMMNEVISTDIIVEDLRSSVINSPTAAELIGLIDDEPENPQPYWPAMRVKIAGINVSASNPYVEYFSLANINLDGTKITKNGTGKLGDLDLKTPSGMSAAELDTKLSGTMMAGLGQAFKDAETKHGVNAVFLCALAIHESDWGKSQIARDKKNLFGWGANDSDPYNLAKTFDSYADSVDRVASKIKDWYLTPGGQFYTDPTITGVNTIYCSTPTWSDGVGSLMLELASVSSSPSAPADAQDQITEAETRVASNTAKLVPIQYWPAVRAQQVFLTFEEDEPRPYLQENNYYKDITNLVDCGDIPSGVTHNTDYYESTGENLEDYYKQEYKDIGMETWGLVHSATLYWCVVNRETDSTAHFKEQCGDAFKPLLYYKPSTITTVTVNDKGESETDTEDILLLTEADTIRGHYKYSYKWDTETYPNGGSKTYEMPLGKTLVSHKEWERLDKWIDEVLNPIEDQKRLVREMLIQAAVGYDAVDQNIPWLFEKLKEDAFGSLNSVSIPDQASFKNAETATGIPSWFLLGLAKHLSGLDNNKVDSASKATGYMQIMPSEREQLLDKMLADYKAALPPEMVEYINSVPESKRDATFYENIFKNPTVNVLAGAIILVDQGLQPSSIDWKDDASWMPATEEALIKFYGATSVPKSAWPTYGISSEDQAKDPAKIKEYVIDTQVNPIQQAAKDMQSSGLVPPLDPGYPITSHRQYNRDINGEVNDHKGVDFGAPEGTPVYAAVDGAVTIAGWTGDGAWGWTVAIVSATGETFFCGHFCQEPTVKVGQVVRAGETIGFVGNTGKSTGNHLHFQIFKWPVSVDNLGSSNNMESTLDPEAYYAERGVPIN